MKNLGSYALLYAEKLNFHIFPLKERSKQPATSHGLKDATNQIDQIKNWWDGTHFNIGLRTGEISGVWVLDVDGQPGIDDLESLEAINGPLPKTPVQKTTNGKHYFFAYPQGLTIGNKAKLIKHDKKGGLDVRGNGGYVVLAPSIHPDSGLAYEWLVKPSNTPLALAPKWLLDLVVNNATTSIIGPQAIRTTFTPPPSRISRRTSPQDIINDQLAIIQNAPQGQRNHTLNVAALKVGKVIAHADISETVAKMQLKQAALASGLSPDEIDATINSGFKFGITQPYEYGKNKEPITSIDRAQKLLTTTFNPQTGEIIEEPTTETPKSKFNLLGFNDLLYHPKVEWIIKGIFPKKSFGVIYGEPGKGKTFVALDIALSVAHGVQWHGTEVVQGSVLYIAGEGMGGLPKRLKAWMATYAPKNETPPFYAIAANVNMRQPEDVNEIVKAIDALQERFSLIIIDTVARAILGGDENSATDMGLFVAACDHIKEHTGSTVIGVHHSGKDADKGMRGSSALLGAVDSVIFVDQPTEGQIVLTNEKQKDAEPFKPMVFKTAIIATGIDETSLIIEPDAETPIYQKTVKPKVDLYLEALWDCIAEDDKTLNGKAATSLEKWRDICYRRNLGGDNYEAQKKGFYRARNRLQSAKQIYVDGALISYTGDADNVNKG